MMRLNSMAAPVSPLGNLEQFTLRCPNRRCQLASETERGSQRASGAMQAPWEFHARRSVHLVSHAPEHVSDPFAEQALAREAGAEIVTIGAIDHIDGGDHRGQKERRE